MTPTKIQITDGWEDREGETNASDRFCSAKNSLFGPGFLAGDVFGSKMIAPTVINPNTATS